MHRFDLEKHPNPLSGSYRDFRVADRLLLTGHSHQAWPDRARRGLDRAWEDAAERVDTKWERAFAKAERVKRGYAERLDDTTGTYSLGANTHELALRFLSALPWSRRRRLLTTDGEFHSIRRQLERLREEGVTVDQIPAAPASTVAERLAAQVDERTAAVLVSSVFFLNAEITPNLGDLATACERVGAELLIDSYHSVNAVPLSLPAEGLDGAWVVGGGYKYMQLGEGNCFLRVPPGRDLRPAITGWFAEFELLGQAPDPDRVAYGPGAAAFAGSTYDPTSHYRAAEVLDFFDQTGLDVATLRRISQSQMTVLIDAFDALDLPPDVIDRDRALPLVGRGGFLALRTANAGDLSSALAARGLATDSRGSILRLGPAPYLSNRQLRDAIALLGETVRARLG